ncbi:MAG: HlyD family efflux transporter periplasmic adaptor subunit [Anaerolineales bacterium]|nr:HlyD family efflux transporter periplasmic adaptor subunit [Anaerolineales bacterium]
MNIKNWFGKIPKKILAGTALAILITAGAVGYSVFASQKETTSEDNTLQTASVSRGDMTISASGTGVLSVLDEVELSFTTSGAVMNVFVQAGDLVEAGEILAETDATEAQSEFDSAKRAYMELTSPTAVASALDALAQAQKDYTDSLYKLEYLISPDVMYWELKIAEAQNKLELAQSQLNANPSDEQVKQQVKETMAYLQDAAVGLNTARNDYYNEYAFEKFVRRKKSGSYLAIPTEADIQLARLAVDDASVALAEAKFVYEAMTSGDILEGTDIPSLLEIQKAKHALNDAQAKLDGTTILAPMDGTVMSVEISPGDQAGTDTVITVAGLSQAYLELYMDESDWDKTVVGYPVEVTFDALPDSVFTGTITTVDSELYSSGTSTAVHGTVTLDASLNEISLPIGASASVEVISLDAKNILLVPLEALHETENGYAVFLITEDGLIFQYITIGAQNELYAEVKSGLNEGDTVALGIEIE